MQLTGTPQGRAPADDEPDAFEHIQVLPRPEGGLRETRTQPPRNANIKAAVDCDQRPGTFVLSGSLAGRHALIEPEVHLWLRQQATGIPSACSITEQRRRFECSTTQLVAKQLVFLHVFRPFWVVGNGPVVSAA